MKNSTTKTSVWNVKSKKKPAWSRQQKPVKLESILLFAVILLCWQGLSTFYTPLVLPGPVLTFKSLLTIFQSDLLFSETLISFKRLMLGLMGAVLVGSVVGIIIGLNQRIRRLLEPLVYFIQSMPPILYITLAMIWFGLNGQATIFIVFVASVPIMVVNIKEGFDNIDIKLIQMGRVFKFSRIKMIREIILPSLKAYFKSALLIIIGLGWKVVVMGEVLSASTGLGSRITDARMNLQTDMVFAWGIIIILLCYTSQKVISALFNLSTARKQYDL